MPCLPKNPPFFAGVLAIDSDNLQEKRLIMAINDIFDDLPGVEDDVRDALEDVGQDISDSAQNLQDNFENSDAAEVLDGSAFQQIWDRSGFSNITGSPDVGNLNDLAGLAENLPAGLGDPDGTGEVPTGLSSFTREQAEIGTKLAAAARIVEAFGPDAAFVDLNGYSFQVVGRYEDLASGFSAVRLRPVGGGHEVFSIDGLEVGSRADEVAAATLGRLQVESSAFQQLVADAAAWGAAGGLVEITAPSLGGAVAQVAAYEAAQAVLAANPAAAPGTVNLITVDPLGGRDAAEDLNGGSLDPNVLAAINALNIRTEGDIVSRIGSHIGATLTLPALDAAGNEVTLNAADAHVNVVSLLQNLSSEERYAAGVRGAPAEISGFAAASNAGSDAVIDAWLANGEQDDGVPSELQLPGRASFDATGTIWSLDADENGTVDLAVRLNAPASAATQDLVLG